MTKLIASAFLVSSIALAQYKVEPAGPPPSELAPAIAQALVKNGSKIVDANGSVVCEVWLRTTAPTGGKPEPSTTLGSIPHGALLGAIRFTATGSDRRGQTIKPGVYTLRYSFYPINGDHQGVAPQRDFMILLRAEDDKDLNQNFAFDPLMAESRKASGTPHPLCLSAWKADTDFKPGFEQVGPEDWALMAKLGDLPIAVILVGTYAG